MTERPIIMAASSVRAILASRKTQTRRIMKPQPEWRGRRLWWKDGFYTPNQLPIFCPQGIVGDRLWVKETFRVTEDGAIYRADGEEPSDPPKVRGRSAWQSPFYMPRWRSRVLLEIERVRVEPIHSISNEDMRAEGFENRHDLRALWDSLNGRRGVGYSYDENPWVWAITFNLIEAKL